MSIQLTGKDLNIHQVVSVARHHERVELSIQARDALKRSRAFVEELVAKGEVVYGLTTGFGPFKNTVIDQDHTEQLQLNLIRSHATGVGAPFDEEIVRASILVRVNSLLKGHSGIRPIVADRLTDLLNLRRKYPYSAGHRALQAVSQKT